MLQTKSKQAIDAGWLALHPHKFRARRFEQLAILNAGRTGRLACATTEAAIDVLFKRWRLDRKTLLFDGTHQIDATTRAVILITRRYVSRTGFQTKPAVNTGEKFFFFASEDRSER